MPDAVVVDDDGDLHRDARQLHLQDVPVLAVLLDGEIVGDEIDDRRAVLLGRGDENGIGASLRTGGAPRQAEDCACHTGERRAGHQRRRRQ